METFIAIICIIIICITIKKSMVVVRDYEMKDVERNGEYKETLSAGLHFINPFIDTVVHTYDIRVEAIPERNFNDISKNNVRLELDRYAHLLLLSFYLLLVTPLFSIIAIVLFFTKLKSAISINNEIKIKQSVKLIKWLLVIGVITSIISVIPMVINEFELI